MRCRSCNCTECDEWATVDECAPCYDQRILGTRTKTPVKPVDLAEVVVDALRSEPCNICDGQRGWVARDGTWSKCWFCKETGRQ